MADQIRATPQNATLDTFVPPRYRSAGRRPEANYDRRAAADAPLSALRGMVTGVLGAPGDIESLIRMLPGFNKQTVLPTSEDVDKRLPMRELNQTPIGKAFTTAGQLVGGFYTGPGSPLRAIAGLPSAVSRAGRDFAMAAGQPAVNVVKPKGGNWLAGSVERAVEPMRAAPRSGQTTRQLAEMMPANEWIELSDEAGQVSNYVRSLGGGKTEQLSAPDFAMNRWLDTKLGKYIRNEMATPEDPLRALAERGITHAEIRPTGYNVASQRSFAGFPEEGMAKSPEAKLWEDKTDKFVNQFMASDITSQYPKTVEENSWLLKVPPETRVYDILRGADEDLGFAHLTDELRNAINPESGLPAALRLKYSDLEKVTVPQAVERVAKINDWRAAQFVEADMARAMNQATQVVKEYPEQGFKWVELRAPKETGRKVTVEKSEMDMPDMDQREMREFAGEMAFDAGLDEGTPEFNDFVRDMVTDLNRKEMVEMDESYKALEDALKYEGDTMGHCIGGYCDYVVEGRSKIYSLRDKKGQPHVTIEVRPGQRTGERAVDYRELLPENYAAKYGDDSDLLPEIVQIKGKGNKAPKEEYLPAVQDFVRSENWSDVRDLKNAGLYKNNKFQKDVFSRIGKTELADVPYLTKAELDDVMQRLQSESDSAKPQGYAEGGEVTGANFPTDDFDPDRIDAIVGELNAMNAA